MPGRHPDDDLLADLAADVLPLEEARAVESHVLQCDRCAGLLADAEHVRSLLLADDAGPVPADVWHRIETALAAEGARGEPPAPRAVVPLPPADAGPWEDDERWDDGTNPLDDPVAWAAASPRADDRSGDPFPRADVHPRDHRNDHSGAVAPVTGTLRRLTTSRRDTREARDDRRRLGPALLGLAAVVALVAVVGSVRLLGHDGGSSTAAAEADASSSSAAAAADGSAVAGARIVTSGDDYTKATLASRARALVQGATVATPRTQKSGAPAAPGPAGASSAGRAVAPDPKATDVTSPARLAACLSALGVPADRLVAVDLATYQGREAAVIVDRAAAGGYEVWVVERTCGPNQEGNLDFTTLPG